MNFRDEKRCKEIETVAKKMAIALVKKFAGFDFSDPANKDKRHSFTVEQKASCLMAASILYARLGAAFNTPPDGLIGGFLMSMQEAYPEETIRVGMVQREEEKEDTGFLHFNKKPMEC